VLHAVPEIIIDDPQFGDVLDDPFVLRIDPGQPLSRARFLDVALLVPDEPADVELVVQDARAPQGMTSDRRVGPWTASRTQNAFGIEFTGDGAGRLARGERREDAADDGRFGVVDDTPPAYRLAARVELTDDIVPVAQAATGSALAHSAFESAPHLLAQVSEVKRIHRTLEADVKRADLALRGL
jgi:hypothetical protein